MPAGWKWCQPFSRLKSLLPEALNLTCRTLAVLIVLRGLFRLCRRKNMKTRAETWIPVSCNGDVITPRPPRLYFESIRGYFSKTSCTKAFSLIIKTTSQPIMPHLCSAISPDFPHFLLQTASGGTQRCLPSGPASFRATYLPMSGGLIFRWRHDQFILCTLQSASAPSLPAVWFPAAGHLFSSLKATVLLFVAQTGSTSDPSGAFFSAQLSK